MNDVLGCSCRTRGASTPTLTINAGLRWDLQLPFTPVNDIMSTVDDGGRLRHVGHRDGGTYGAATSSSPARPAASVPEFIQFDERHAGLRHRLEQLRAERRRRVAAERPGRLAADAARRSRAGDAPRRLLGRVRTAGHGRLHRACTAPTRAARSASPGREHRLSSGPGESWPVLLQPDADRLYHAPFPETPTYPIALRPSRADDLNIFASGHRDRVGAVPGRSASSGRSRATWRSTSATSARAASISGRRSTTTKRETSSRTASSTSSSLAMANLQANNAAGGIARGSFAYFGPGTGTDAAADLPRVPERHARTSNNPGRLHRRRRPGRTRPSRRGSSRPTRSPSSAGRRSRRQRRRAATTRSRRGCRRTSSCSTRTSTRSNVTDSGAYSDYHALQIELRRRLSQGLLVERQLPVRARGRLGVPRLPLRPRDGSDRQRASRDQDAVGLDDPGRPRPAVRRRT